MELAQGSVLMVVMATVVGLSLLNVLENQEENLYFQFWFELVLVGRHSETLELFCVFFA